MAMAKHSDWIFRSVLACSVLVLGIALLLFVHFLIPIFFLDNLQIKKPLQLPWLQGFDAVVLGAFLLVLAFLLYIAARQRVLSNDRIRPSAGCPSCQETKLIRVSRHSSDRMFALSLIPMGRFVCSNCRWEGLRVIRKGKGTTGRSKPSDSTSLINTSPTNSMDAIFATAVKARALIVKEGTTQEVERGAAAVETCEQPAEPPTAEERKTAGPFPSGEGYRLTDKWSNHVISVHAQAGSDCEDLGEVVGTLHVQIWQRPGAETELLACLDHITTTVSIYKRSQEASRSRS
jgi:hypothetical protein